MLRIVSFHLSSIGSAFQVKWPAVTLFLLQADGRKPGLSFCGITSMLQWNDIIQGPAVFTRGNVQCWTCH